MSPALCFDYSAQRWARVRQPIQLRMEQVSDELTTLESEDGPRYLAFVGAKVGLPEAIAACRRELAELEGRL